MKRGSKNRIRAVSVIVIASFIATILGTNITAFAAESTYNYGEALQKGIMFYEFQRSGKLPADKRDNWRGDSGMDDGKDVGVDLTGGWYDAGDHVKFNLPGAYTAAMLAWSVYEDKDAYVKSGQLKYIMDAIKWETDFLIKCNPEPNVYYFQVGDGDADHKWWGPAEVMQMERPTAKLDLSNPGSAVSAETAAALASAALIFKDTDPDYSKTCLKHAKDLYNFAETTKSDKAYDAVANKFYKSWSGFYDELSWAATWIYMATDDKTYLDKAESYVDNWGREDQSTEIKYRWAHCWDDVHIGAALLLARITEKPIYKQLMEKFFDYWSIGYGTGTSKQRISYTPKGLAYLDTWGALRYATTTAFLASVYTDWKGCTADKVKTYNDFAKSQIDYALGSSGRSYVIGYGVNPPAHPHHRTAQGSWFDQMTVPDYHRHTLYGALVGGPDRTDTYDDTVGNYTQTEVADDYNAGFVGILARMYKKYGGNPIPDFKAIEQKTNDELYVGAKINSVGPSYVEVKGILYNKTGWPARVTDKLSIRYFMDLTEAIKAGCKIEDLKTSLNYNDGATISKVLPWDVSKNIYYVIVDFTGTKIYPGGQSAHRKEAQFRIAAPEGTKFWDNSNDFSFKDIADAETPIPTKYIPVYENGKFVYGLEPSTSENPEIIKGDLDGNMVFNLVDVLAMKKYVLHKLNHFTASIGATEEERAAADLKLADFNSDGKINSIDYLLIKKDFIDSTNK